MTTCGHQTIRCFPLEFGLTNELSNSTNQSSPDQPNGVNETVEHIVWHNEAPLAWSWCDWKISMTRFHSGVGHAFGHISTCEQTAEAYPRGWTTVSEGFLCTSTFVSCRSMLERPKSELHPTIHVWFSFFLTMSSFFLPSWCWDQCRHMKSGDATFLIAQTWSSCRPWREPYKRLISLEARNFFQFSKCAFLFPGKHDLEMFWAPWHGFCWSLDVLNDTGVLEAC